DAEGQLQLEKIFLRVAETARSSGGTVVWLQLRWYPLIVLMYAAGSSGSAKRLRTEVKRMLRTTSQWVLVAANARADGLIAAAPSTDPIQARVISAAFKRQRLHEAVDLVVVPSLGKYQQFCFKLWEKRRSPREQHLAGIKLRLLDVGATDFVALD